MEVFHEQSFDPPPFGKAQLEQLIASYSVSVASLAQTYKNLGESYHELPLHVRSHEHCPTAWQNYCSLAFTEALARARAAILCNEFALAISRLAIAALLAEEAEHRVAKLSYAMTCYQDLQESLIELVGVPVLRAAYGRDGSERSKRGLIKLQWVNALPKCLQDAEEKMADSGYGSSCSSVIVE